MKTNTFYFEYSKQHPEEIFDPFYAKDAMVISDNPDNMNRLMENNHRMIDLITTFENLRALGYGKESDSVIKTIEEIIRILDTTESINFSAFSQFFMVYNFNYSLYKNLQPNNKKEVIYELLCKYCAERHYIYKRFGYSDIVLQVMCDNYSHKRNGKTGIQKIENMIPTFKKASNIDDCIKCDNIYFLPDKDGKAIFNSFLQYYSIKMESRKIEQDKYPDIVIKHNDHFYICELKTMKEGGGGQNKQVVEFAYFIRFTETNDKIHYLTFLDGNYSNLLFNSSQEKVKNQRNDILKALNENKNNYFVNTEGMKKFLEDLLG